MTTSTPVTIARHAVLAPYAVTDHAGEAPGMTMHAPQAEQPEPGRRRWAVLTVVSAAQFLIVLGLWVVNVALPGVCSRLPGHRRRSAARELVKENRDGQQAKRARA